MAEHCIEIGAVVTRPPTPRNCYQLQVHFIPDDDCDSIIKTYTASLNDNVALEELDQMITMVDLLVDLYFVWFGGRCPGAPDHISPRVRRLVHEMIPGDRVQLVDWEVRYFDKDSTEYYTTVTRIQK